MSKLIAHCAVCHHACKLANGQYGLCKARRAVNGEVVLESYGHLSSLALDPIEKKPIACWRPGTKVLSLGSYGCNMRCPYCQNASIAQAGIDDVSWRNTSPKELVATALSLKNHSCIGIAYTFNEPLIAWEYVCDTARLAHTESLANVLVSNGQVTKPVLNEIVPFIDAANIDLKCFSEKGYHFLGGDLAAAKHTIEELVASKTCHVEVTTLVVPGFSDSTEEIEAISRWLATLSPSIPYHLTRFFPQYRMTQVAPTSLETLRYLEGVAHQHLETVLLGNV